MGLSKRVVACAAAGALAVTGYLGTAPVIAAPGDLPLCSEQPSLSPPDCEEAASPAPVETPKPKPSPSKPAEPSDDSPAKPGKKPTKPQQDKEKLTPAEKKRREEARKKAEEAAAAHAAAQAALVDAEQAMADVEPKYQAAQDNLDRVMKRKRLQRQEIEDARNLLARVARQAYVEGIDPSILHQVAMLSADSPAEYANSQTLIGAVGEAQNSKLEAAQALIDRIETQEKKVREAFDAIKPQYDLVRLNLASAKAALGLGPSVASDPEFFTDYPVPECSFEITHKTTKSCQEAMQFAIEQAQAPMKDWFYLCLNLVTIAYGAPETIPRAIDMWNSMPAESKRSANTVAPPGALMFWAPNHVAISLGNNMMASTDVLGNGRIWIVSMETIQSRWNFPYLGWTEPDFSQA